MPKVALILLHTYYEEQSQFHYTIIIGFLEFAESEGRADRLRTPDRTNCSELVLLRAVGAITM